MHETNVVANNWLFIAKLSASLGSVDGLHENFLGIRPDQRDICGAGQLKARNERSSARRAQDSCETCRPTGTCATRL